MLHFADNETCSPGNKMHKIEWLIKSMNEQFQKCCIIGQKICIAETMEPFQGRLSFRQYIPKK